MLVMIKLKSGLRMWLPDKINKWACMCNLYVCSALAQTNGPEFLELYSCFC